jgi:CheY-like chemotaxis protein
VPKILIVEDDLTIQAAYKLVLEAEGFDVLVANDGVAAMEQINSVEPDVILLDMLMPNMDGLQFLEAYDLKGKHPNVKVISFSNMSVPESKAKALELGVSRYLTKSSFTPKHMVEQIREVLAK